MHVRVYTSRVEAWVWHPSVSAKVVSLSVVIGSMVRLGRGHFVVILAVYSVPFTGNHGNSLAITVCRFAIQLPISATNASTNIFRFVQIYR